MTSQKWKDLDDYRNEHMDTAVDAVRASTRKAQIGFAMWAAGLYLAGIATMLVIGFIV